MLASIKELCTNVNFILKLAVTICGVVLIFLSYNNYDPNISIGLELSCLDVMVVFLFAYLFRITTKKPELGLLIAALIKLLIACIVYATEYYDKVDVVDTRASPSTESALRYGIPTSLPRPLPTIINTLATTIHNVESVPDGTDTPVDEVTAPIIEISEEIRKLYDKFNENAQRKREAKFELYTYAERDDNRYYLHLVITTIAMILITIDIILRARKN